MEAIHMDCPRCGGRQTAEAHDITCEYCSINMPLFIKSRNMSDAHYDRGLELAKARNLTASIEELTSALQINKKNIKARNLLGLCYHATGRIGEALREWVISSNYGADENLAKDYILDFQDDIPLLESYADGLHNYNEALHYMNQGSEDLAVIRLKRAIEINPNFVDALNLLALCYMMTGERQRAGVLVERVLMIDVGNPFARRYYREIYQKKVPAAKRLKIQVDDTEKSSAQSNASEKSIAQQKSERQNPFAVQSQRAMPRTSHISGILLFVAGLGAMFLFMFVLVLPSYLEESLSESERLSTELSTRQTTHASQISDRDETIASLNEQLDDYRRLSADQENFIDNLQNVNWVNTAHAYLTRDQAREALSALENVDVARLSSDVDALSTYNYVRHRATPIVEENYYQLGETLFNTGNYDLARENLERAANLIVSRPNPSDSEVGHYVFYYLGRIAEIQEEFAVARYHYQRVIDDFPGTNRVNAAQTRLNQLQ